MDAERQKRIAEVAGIAVMVERLTKVPAESTVAQWAVESRWGTAPCGRHNYFGIKKADRHKLSCVKTTKEFFTEGQVAAWNKSHPGTPVRFSGRVLGGKREVMLDDEFADYASLEDSVKDYAWLVSHGAPYREAWTLFLAAQDVSGFVAGISKAYSTSPQYAALVGAVSAQSNVTEPINAARQV